MCTRMRMAVAHQDCICEENQWTGCNPRAIFVNLSFREIVASSEATTDSHWPDSTNIYIFFIRVFVCMMFYYLSVANI